MTHTQSLPVSVHSTHLRGMYLSVRNLEFYVCSPYVCHLSIAGMEASDIQDNFPGYKGFSLWCTFNLLFQVIHIFTITLCFVLH